MTSPPQSRALPARITNEPSSGSTAPAKRPIEPSKKEPVSRLP